MPVSLKSIVQIASDIVSSVESETSKTVPLLDLGYTRVLARAISGQVYTVWQYVGFCLMQTSPKYAYYGDVTIAGTTFNPLLEWGRLRGVSDPVTATRPTITATVVPAATGTLTTSTQWLNAKTGVVYTLVSNFTITGGMVGVSTTLTLTSVGTTGLGALGNPSIGDVLTIVSPSTLINKSATVASITVYGSDPELESDYRSRVLVAWRARGAGGAPVDYVSWARDVVGITNVYPYRIAPGTVTLYCEATTASSGSADGIPTGAQLTAVNAAVQLTVSGVATRRPAGTAVNAVAISRSALNVNVIGVAGAAVGDVSTALQTAADEYLRSLEPYIEGVTSLPRRDSADSAVLGAVLSDVLRARGATFSSVELLNGSTAIPRYILNPGEKMKLGTISVT